MNDLISRIKAHNNKATKTALDSLKDGGIPVPSKITDGLMGAMVPALGYFLFNSYMKKGKKTMKLTGLEKAVFEFMKELVDRVIDLDNLVSEKSKINSDLHNDITKITTEFNEEISRLTHSLNLHKSDLETTRVERDTYKRQFDELNTRYNELITKKKKR